MTRQGKAAKGQMTWISAWVRSYNLLLIVLSVGPVWVGASGLRRELVDRQPYHPNLLTFRWGRMLDELGISRVRLHDARHSCATPMYLRQVPIAVIAAWLGHASAAFTLSVYAHSQYDA